MVASGGLQPVPAGPNWLDNIMACAAINAGSDAVASFIMRRCRSTLTPCRMTPTCCSRCCATMLHQQSELHAENDKLRLLIQRLTRHQFGRRSEQLTDEQLQFGLEDLEQTIAENQAGQDAAVVPPAKPRVKRAARNHGALPCPPAAL